MNKNIYSHVEDTTSNIYMNGSRLPSGVAMEMLKDYEKRIAELQTEIEQKDQQINNLVNVVGHSYRTRIVKLEKENEETLMQNQDYVHEIHLLEEELKSIKKGLPPEYSVWQSRWENLKKAITLLIENSKAIKLSEFGKGELGGLESILAEMNDLEGAK